MYHIGMGSTNIFTVRQVRIVKRSKNLKHEILKYNAHMYFKKQCWNLDVITKLANIKIKNASPGSKHTQHKVQVLRIKDGKYLYIKRPVKFVVAAERGL
jgi:hypothetical protein